MKQTLIQLVLKLVGRVQSISKTNKEAMAKKTTSTDSTEAPKTNQISVNSI